VIKSQKNLFAKILKRKQKESSDVPDQSVPTSFEEFLLMIRKKRKSHQDQDPSQSHKPNNSKRGRVYDAQN